MKCRVIAIDGHGGSGKTTFAKLLANELGAKVIHTDEFATDKNPLNWWPEVIEKVLKPAKDDKENTGYLILEGVSSLRREFRQYIDFGIFIDTPIDVCRERMQNREKDDEQLDDEFEDWLTDEIDYMKRDNPKEFADVVIDGSKQMIEQINGIEASIRQKEAKKFIEARHLGREVRWIDKGQMNFIAIVGDEFVYKFPKTPDSFKLLAKEHEIYKLLGYRTSLNIPRPIELSEKQQYLKLSYVVGRNLTVQEASSLTNAQRQSLADTLVAFIREMNSAELKDGFDEIFKSDINDFYYVENWLKKIAAFCEGKTDELCEKYTALYRQFSDTLTYGFCVGELIAHKDLHEDNMLFDDNNELVGVIDFAEVRYTSIYSELRTVVRFGVDTVEKVLAQLGGLAGDAKASDILLFARVYEMAIIVQDKYIKKELPWRVDLAEYYEKVLSVLEKSANNLKMRYEPKK